jgi:hypothetical protein
MKDFFELREAVSPAQQAAIAISKKEKGEKPKDVKEYGGPKISRAAYLKKGKEYHQQNEADDKGEYDNEGEMAKTQLRGVVADASHMIKMFSDDQNLPEWVQSKITKAADYLKSAHSYMMNKDDDGDTVKEAKGSNSQLYHNSFSAAVQHAMKQAQKKGYEVDEEDWQRKVASGPSKPSAGKTNRYAVNLMKNGKPVKQKLHMQVYGMDSGKYELNMYVS